MKFKNNIKRIISAFSAVCMLAALMTVSVSAEDSPAGGWDMKILGELEAEAAVDASQSYDGAQSVKFTNKSEGKPNVYLTFTTTVPVKKNRTYKFGFAAKGEGVKGTANYCINWGKRYVFRDMYGENFDWVKKTFLWTNDGGDGNATIRIIIDGLADGLWIDDFEFYEWDGEIVGNNLVKNASFEKDKATITGEKVSAKPVDLDKAKDAEEIASAIKNTDTFDGEKYKEAMPMFSDLPLLRKDNIVIDGDSSDWDGIYKVHVPLSESQYTVYTSTAHLDLEMDYMAAYDDDNFYIYIETTDDIFAPDAGAQYWQNDSVQIAMGDRTESFGDEVGLKYTPEGGYFVSNSWRFDEVSKIKLKTEHKGNKTIYEAAIPWSVQFGERPKSDFVFSILANDNDGKGREYCVELRPGIAEGKTNTEFISYNLMQPGEDFYSTLEEVNGAYAVLVVNNSDKEKKFDVTSQILGLNEQITVEAGMGKRVLCEKKEFNLGKNDISVDISDGTVTRTLCKTIDVIPDKEKMEKIYTGFSEKTKELERIAKICRMLGYPTDYEDTRIWTIKRFIGDLKDDFESGYYYPIASANDALEKMYKEAKENMLSYIAKTKEAYEVPKYRTGDVEIDGQTLWANMKTGSKTEKRPAYFIGYGHFFEVQRDIPVLENVSASAQAIEIGTNAVVTSKDTLNYLDGWVNYGINSLEGLEYGQKETEGSNGKAFYLHNSTPSGPNKYAFFYQMTEGLSCGETYVVKFRAKANNATGCNLVFNGVSDIRNSLDGTYDWKDFEFEIKMKKDQTRIMWGLVCENLTDELWIDDMSFSKKGEDRNFCINGGFEYTRKLKDGYAISEANIARLGDILDELAEHNQTLDLLISPHYFPYDLLENSKQLGSGGFLRVDISDKQAREIIKLQIEELIGPYKDHPALKEIIITNEPTFAANKNGDIYIGEYRNWLKELYSGDISKLNENYGTSYKSFDEVEWQTEDFTPGFYDYVRFNNEFFNEFHSFMAQCVKETAPKLAVSAKPMDYNAYSDAGGKRGYHSYGVDFTLFSKWMDINGCDSWAYYNSATYNTMQGKMQWYDFMRSIKKAPGQNSEDHIIADGNMDYVPEQAKWVEADLWQGAIHGRNISNIWLWDTDYVNTPAGGSIRFRPDCIVAASDVAMDLNRLSYEATVLQTKKADVGILYTISSRNYNLAWMNAVYRAWEAISYNGRKAEYITEDQLDKMFDFPMLIIPENYAVSEKTAAKVAEYAEKGGRVIMIGEDCLKYNEYNKPVSADEKLRSLARIIPAVNQNEVMTSPLQEDLKKIIGEELEKLNLKKIKLINADTGEELNKVDYIYTEYNGKTLLNLCLYDWTDSVNIKIETDGKTAEKIKNLRSGELFCGTISISGYKPMLLEL